MKLIIAGSRKIDINGFTLLTLLSHVDIDLPDIDQVVSGGAEGIDRCGEQLAHEFLYDRDDYLKVFEAKWDDLNHPKAVIKSRADGTKYNAMAGPLRNKEMAEYADALFLMWNGVSKGSASMKREMKKLNKPIYEIILKRP